MRHEPTVIVGAGPIGIAAALAAQRRHLRPLVVDSGPVARSIVGYPVGMTFFTTPERLEIGGHPLVSAGQKPTREDALKYYRGVVRTEGIRVETYTKLIGATRVDGRIECHLQSTLRPTEPGSLVTCDRLVVATGYFDHPNRLGVPGEDLPHVSHYMDEAHVLAGLDVVVVGGKNSAVEMALSGFRAGARVTLVHRGLGLKPSVKYWLEPDLANRIKAGEIGIRWGATVERIDPRTVAIRRPDGGGIEALPADRVFLLTGYRPDADLFQRIGIGVDPTTGKPDHDPDTLETNVPGVYLAGSVTAGNAISEIFIENGRYDGDRIFGDPGARNIAATKAASVDRPVGE